MDKVESPDILLQVKNLKLSFHNSSGISDVLKGVSFTITRGSSLALLGDSGSGKSVTVLGMLDLLPAYVRKEISGEAFFCSKNTEPANLIGLPNKALDEIRGKKIAMIFQDPMNALNPIQKCGKQIRESVEVNLGLGRKASAAKALELIGQVGLEDAQRVYNSYPHELSGGQLQRVVTAMALGGEPELLIADEPTTNLDQESKESILMLLTNLKRSKGLSLLYITHDIQEAKRMADELCTLTGGKVDHSNAAVNIVSGIDRSKYSDQKKAAQADLQPILKIENLTKNFSRQSILGFKKENVLVFKDLNFKIGMNAVTGLVGRSGSGKTTLGRVILKLEKADSGSVLFNNLDLLRLQQDEMRNLRQKLQIVYQNPYNTLNPRMKIRDIVTEPLIVHHLYDNNNARREKASELLNKVGIDISKHKHYMYQLSGGQRQRVAIARSMILNPKFIVLDECISSLDIRTQNRIIDLLLLLKEDYSLSYFFISHDLQTVKAISDKVFELKDGILEKIKA